MNSWTVRNMCLFSGSRRSKLPYSSVLMSVWPLVLARILEQDNEGGNARPSQTVAQMCIQYTLCLNISFNE